jgi:uncharacterized protein (DUF2384 family)
MSYGPGNFAMEALLRGRRKASEAGVAGVVPGRQAITAAEVTYNDVQQNLRIDEERIDHVAEWLEVTIGMKLTAFAVGCSPGEITRYAHGDDEPAPTTEKRLRNLYAVAWYKVVNDGGGSAQEWLLQPNPDLDDRTPAELLREGEKPESVWFAVAPTF